MTKDEHTTLIEQIRTAQDDATRTPLLLNLQSDYNAQLTQIDELTKKVETVTAERDRYAKANNDLWLQVNSNGKQDNSGNDNSGNDNNEPPKKRSFDDLDFSE